MVDKYPVSYRGGEKRRTGFQSPLSPVPAFVGSAAAWQRTLTPAFERSVGVTALAETAKWSLGKLALRAVPYVGTALLAYELYELYQSYPGGEPKPELPNIPGYTIDHQCPGLGGRLYPSYGYVCGSLAISNVRCISTYPDYLYFSYRSSGSSDLACDKAFYSQGGVRMKKIVGAPVYGPVTIDPATDGWPQVWTVVQPYRDYRTGRPVSPVVFDPMLLPIGQPVPSPAPLPWRAIPERRPNPYRVDQPTSGYYPPGEEPARPPESVPDVVAEPGGVYHQPPSHQYRPPGPREKERKARVRLPAGFLRVVSEATEYLDYLDALYDALDRQYKVRFPSGRIKKVPTPQEKARALYYAFDKVDGAYLKRALKNLLTNEIEDRLIGAASQKASRINRYLGRPVGIQTGPAL